MYLPRAVEVSSESKSVHTLFVIGAEVVDDTIVPAVFCPDFSMKAGVILSMSIYPFVQDL